MKNIFVGSGAIGCLGMLVVSTILGCGSTSDGGGNSAICDVDFADLAGTYSFKMTIGRMDYTNSCFESSNSDTDPATLTNCTWSEKPDLETLTLDLVVDDDGNIGNATITSVKEDILNVNCEMLQGELCNAPVRCTYSSDKCAAIAPEPDEWKWRCNCSDGGMNDPMGQACQACKVSYEKFQAESTAYCQKERDSRYIEFTLNVK